ncbi:MAG: hypothetical protein RBS81_08260 [Tenuifilaceae bacterium]|jgi:predicted alpha/beta-fold hydrolase|nr:hypothetical protein [Tenuifilaceae bacterium]
MKIKNSDFHKKLTFEFISVAFAVFLGLMLNQWKDNRNNRKTAEIAINNIVTEINENTKRLKNMLESHKALDAIIDSVMSKQLPSNALDTASGLTMNLLQSTAWETAKLTEAIAYIDVNIVKEVAGIYEFQDYYKTIVKEFVLQDISNPEELSPETTLRYTNKFLDKIIPIETNLLQYYDELLKTIEKHQ